MRHGDRHACPSIYLVLAKLAVALCATWAMTSRAAEAARDAAIVLSVDGTPAPLSFTTAEFAALPRARVTWAVHDRKAVCEGPWLIDILARAGLPTGEAVRGKLLSTVVVATGRDGYRAVFTVGELDPMLGNAPVVIADRCGGAALSDADGPVRIVVASDRRGARSVRQLARLSVTEVPVTAAPR